MLASTNANVKKINATSGEEITLSHGLGHTEDISRGALAWSGFSLPH